jgi:predicted nicotinamide N-methyase
VQLFNNVCVSVRVSQAALAAALAGCWLCCAAGCCRELVCHREIFQGQQVLELGSGTGLVGLVAAAAGAQQVRTRVLANVAGCAGSCWLQSA